MYISLRIPLSMLLTNRHFLSYHQLLSRSLGVMHLFLGMIAFLTGLFYSFSPLTAGETTLHTLKAFDPLLYSFGSPHKTITSTQNLKTKPATVLFLPSTQTKCEIKSRFAGTSTFHKPKKETRTLDEACLDLQGKISDGSALRLTLHVKKGNPPLCLHAEHIHHLSITVDEKIYPLTLGDLPGVTHVTLNSHLSGVTHLPEGLATLPKLRTLSFTVHDPFLLSVPQALAAKNPVMSCHPILEHTHLDGQQGWAGLYDESTGVFPAPTPGNEPSDSSGDSSDNPRDTPPNDAPKELPLYNRFPIVACDDATAAILTERWNMPMNPCRLCISREQGVHAPDPDLIRLVQQTFADPVITTIRIFNDASPEGWDRQKEIAVPDFVPPFADIQKVLKERCDHNTSPAPEAALDWSNAIEVTSQGTLHKMIGRLEVEPVFSKPVSDGPLPECEANFNDASGFSLTLEWSQAEIGKPLMMLSLGPLYIKNTFEREGHPTYYTEALAQKNYQKPEGKNFMPVHQVYEGASYVRAFLTHVMNTLMAQTLRHQHAHARKDAPKDTARIEKASQNKVPAHHTADSSKEGSC